ncbi:MAG: hypothetical protein ACKVG5_13470 [Acidimicrobiales bacterium]
MFTPEQIVEISQRSPQAAECLRREAGLEVPDDFLVPGDDGVLSDTILDGLGLRDDPELAEAANSCIAPVITEILQPSSDNPDSEDGGQDIASNACGDSDVSLRIRSMVCTTPDSGWKRIDDTTISFTGPIELGSLTEFRSVFDERVTTVIVNSAGGETSDAVKIGLDLVDAGVDVIVDGYCLSSCANYLFLAGETKDLQDGLVGFHGNLTALIQTEGDGTLESIFGAAQPAEVVERYTANITDEAEFLEATGVSQAWFDLTQSPPGGFEFLMPTAAHMTELNITGVVGDQNPDLLAEMKTLGGDKVGVLYPEER